MGGGPDADHLLITLPFPEQALAAEIKVVREKFPDVKVSYVQCTGEEARKDEEIKRRLKGTSCFILEGSGPLKLRVRCGGWLQFLGAGSARQSFAGNPSDVRCWTAEDERSLARIGIMAHCCLGRTLQDDNDTVHRAEYAGVGRGCAEVSASVIMIYLFTARFGGLREGTDHMLFSQSQAYTLGLRGRRLLVEASYLQVSTRGPSRMTANNLIVRCFYPFSVYEYQHLRSTLHQR
jgi:hypothetical protein